MDALKPPNVILLTIDTLRADMLGCYGYPRPITPNIDRLASTGIRFEQAITGGSWTQAAFPVLLTSTYASMYGGCLGPLSPRRPSPVEALARGGYATGGFSTSPLLSPTYGYDRGFDHYVDLVPAESDPFLRQIKGGHHLLRQPLTHRVAALFGQRTRPARIYVSAEELVGQVSRWMADAPTPFFAWAHFMDVHWPYYREEALTEPDEIARAWQDLGNMHGANWNGRATTEAQRARYLAQYERAVEYTDAQIGRLLDFLEASGQLDDTIVVVTSDHGEEFLERRHWGHFEVNLYDEIVKVPLIVRLPQASRPATIRQQVRLLDVMPTILDLTDCAPPAGLEGISMRPLWDGRESDYPAEIAISEMWRDHRHMVAVRTEAYKYIWDSRKPEQRELYDLHTDPDERENLCASRPDLAGRFQAEVDAHLRRVAALTSPSGPDVEPVLDEQVIRRLRDLGYVE